jgi:hypothetical protein
MVHTAGLDTIRRRNLQTKASNAGSVVQLTFSPRSRLTCALHACVLENRKRRRVCMQDREVCKE